MTNENIKPSSTGDKRTSASVDTNTARLRPGTDTKKTK